MWRVLFVLVVVCVVCLFPAQAQVINEAESSFLVKETLGEINLVLENPAQTRTEKISLELLDTENKTVSHASPSFELKSGKHAYTFSLSLENWSKKADDDLI